MKVKISTHKGGASISNTACDSIEVETSEMQECGLAASDLFALANTPLACIGLEEFVFIQHGVQPPVQAHMPFDLYSHPAAATPVAQEMLERLHEDVAGFAKECAELAIPLLRIDFSQV